MGYTHYWTQTRNLSATEMGQTKAALDQIRKATKVPLAGWDGEGEVEANEKTIGFNGVRDDGCETFRILAKRELPYEGADRSRLGWAFCKTRGRPYDVIVTALLTVLCAKYDFKVSSDGDTDDFEPGIKLAAKALGEILPNPLRASS